MAKPIKIRITLEFNVDPDVWANEYGLEPDQAKDDARGYFPQLVREYVRQMSHVSNGVVDYVNQD